MGKREDKNDEGRVKMSATDSEGNTHTMEGWGTTSRTQSSPDGRVVQTDGDQIIRG